MLGECHASEECIALYYMLLWVLAFVGILLNDSEGIFCNYPRGGVYLFYLRISCSVFYMYVAKCSPEGYFGLSFPYFEMYKII